ncbi:DoxX family protein [Olivibacter sp. SDN3]|uniref:DoxX family protein n=1 Tax=Olivibacter sp. SDN3 TaxID=2764720 RepID=UPI0016517619|nr:DoxX family protein [Olivibacter sp. SDN3]QNL51984.1 DoxX family protein [Olivibacter sp. SDN3]
MKAIKMTYYLTTGLISFAMLFSTYAYLTKPELKEAFQHLGFPDYFRIELAIAKCIAAIALWLPVRLLKEAAYIGLAISFVSAIISHIVLSDTTFHTVAPIVVLTVLIVSYATYAKMNRGSLTKAA